MNITIVGAGNIGLAVTAYLTMKQSNNIILFTEKNILLNGPLTLKDIEGECIYKTSSFKITSSKKDAFAKADIILCTYPAFLRKTFIENIAPYMHAGVKLGFIPGYGGIEYSCTSLIRKGVVVFGLQRVPYVARSEKTEKGMIANILSKKKKIYTAAIPYNYSFEIKELLESLLDIPCTVLREYLAITLVPSNPLLHTTGIYHIFHDYHKGQVYEKNIRFYEKWDNIASVFLLKYDEELQNICKGLYPLVLDDVISLKCYYEAETPEEMTKKLKSIKSFNTVMAPLEKTEYGFVPDLNSRMFAEDFPYGVCLIKAFAKIAGVKSQIVDTLLEFYEGLSGNTYFNKDGTLGKNAKDTGIPFLFGLDSCDKILEFYHA